MSDQNKKGKLNLFLALLPLLVVIVFGLLSVIKWKAGMTIPIISGIITAGLIGIRLGFKWDELQQGLIKGVSRALAPLFIIMIIGLIIGSWIQGGIIPSLIYFSLRVISPKIFVPATALVTAVIATATGTSFTSIATVGLALMATGLGMGFPAPLLAGAIISGAYFGDSISPLSDTTNLASAMSNCTLFELVGHLAKSGGPALLLSLIIYYVLGMKQATQAVINISSIAEILQGLDSAFVISPWLLLIPVITIVFSIKKFPAIPSLISVAIMGGLAAIFVQGADIGSVVKTMTNGFTSNTGIKMVDSLLTRGGINSMGGTVILLTLAVALGGILEEIGSLELILEVIMKKVSSAGQLVIVTILSSLVTAFATGAQLLAIMIPARMFQKAYSDFNLHPKNLGRVAQSIGCICINLVPWSVPALFAQSVLGVQAMEFVPYIFFAYFTIIINIIYGFTGFTLDKVQDTAVNQ
ncbi:MAG: Na+/H+ antiporter NhaC [Sedimentibacter sp.]|uniref:Na+/H+ antiporter NhaC n=1 Tax=Sedimentibacter sp. TaxID=1960295 RepID=UPI00315872E3